MVLDQSIMVSFTFYLFATITVVSGLLVITARNPVHSVLWLILAFFSAAGLFVLMGAEFLAMLLVIVYVGAVAVLFLFVVMMLDIDFVRLREGFQQYLPFGVIIAAILVAELMSLGGLWSMDAVKTANFAAKTPDAAEVENTAALGQLIYTHYIFIFQTSGMILLVSMIGAIVLTLRSRPGVRRQNVAKQTARRPEDAYKLLSVESGEGLDPSAFKTDEGRS